MTPESRRDRVFGEASVGYQWKNAGTFAEYALVRESSLSLLPESANFEEAAALPTAGFIALQVVRGEERVSRGQRVLINGAGGGEDCTKLSERFAVIIDVLGNRSFAANRRVLRSDGTYVLEKLQTVMEAAPLTQTNLGRPTGGLCANPSNRASNGTAE